MNVDVRTDRPSPDGSNISLTNAEDETMARMAVRLAKLGGWALSVPDQRLTWSDTTAAIHEEPAGFSPRSVEDALRYIAPEYREHVRRTFGGCIDRGVTFEAEVEIVTAKSRRVWVRTIGEAVRDASGVVTEVHGTFQDISEQKLGAKQIYGIAGRLHDALETIGDAFFTLDREWRFTYLNKETERLLNRTRTLLLGQNIWQEFAHIVGTPADTEFHRAMVDAGSARFEQYVPGVERWFAVEAHPTREGIAVYFRDMTERRRDAANYVARMEGRYRGLLEAAPDAMVVVNQAGEIVLLNLQAEKRFGYARDEMLGKTIQMLIPEGFTERLIADGTRTAAEALAQQIGTGIELSARRKDGSTFPIELMLSPLDSEEGILVTAAIRDISVRKAADEHLAQMERRYRGLLEAAPDAMVVVNQAGEIVLLNLQAEKRFGYHRDELVGQQVTNIIPEGFAERLIADGTRTAAEALAQQIGTGIELFARRKDGSSFPIEIMLSPLESDDGILVTAAIRDISVRKIVDTHLAQMEARYRGLLEAAPDAMVVVNDVGEIVILNTQVKRLFGYTRDEMLGKTIQLLIPEGFAERLIADGTRTAAEALAQQIGTGIELSARRKDGSSFPIEIMLSPLQSDDGILVTAAIRDITVRKDAETHLAQMEARYRGLLEAAPDAMVVVNQAGEIVLLNLQAEQRFGYHRDELVGQKVTNIIPEGFAERLIADGTRTAAEALAQQIGTGIELSARRKDGSSFPIEIMLSPLQSDDGILVTAAIRDITVRKDAETHLAQMEGRYRGLLEAAPMAMVLVNPTGGIVLVNLQAEKQFGHQRDELVGQHIKKIIPEDAAEFLILDAVQSTADALAEQIRIGSELNGRHANGTTFPIEIVLSPLRSDEGVLVSVAIRDITAQKKAEAQLVHTVEELNRSNAELEQFAYIASHDLQEPLRMVASYTQLLSKRYTGKLDADADEFIAFAVDGANRMQRLIQDLLAYSRIGTKRKELMVTSSEKALTQAVLNLGSAIDESGALVTHDALPTVFADEGQLVQLFQNLLGNAIKYQSPGVPKIHVSSSRNAERKWTFSVQDNGLGIESKYFERIFGMFQRLHKREEFAGTGIGLAICKKIVERHGGKISIESQSGQGSIFRFDLAGR